MPDDDQNAMTLDGLEDSRRALRDLVERMGRTLYVYTPVVRPELYNDDEVLSAIRTRVVSQPKVRLQLLLPPARDWRNSCPGLVRLGERLTTALVLRTPDRNDLPDRPELGQAFAIADERTLLHFTDPRRLLGSYQPKPTERMKELLELFREIWNRAQADPDLRWLGI